MVGAVFVVSSIVRPLSVLPSIILMAVGIPFRNFYIRTTRDLKRLDALAKSPLYGHISNTMDGLSTIRAFGVQREFERQFTDFMHDSTATQYASIMTTRGFVMLTLDCLSLVYLVAVAIILIAFNDGINVGHAGLMLTTAVTLIDKFQSIITQSTEFETQMISVERVLEYKSLPAEAALTSAAIIGSWPTKGQIKFDDVYLSYGNDSEPVLKGLNLEIFGGEKVKSTFCDKSIILTICLDWRCWSNWCRKVVIDHCFIQTCRTYW